MLRITLLLVVMATVAQVFPSCGSDESAAIVGWVETKRIDQFSHAFVIVINSTDYEVPGYFWQKVEVGDLVKWDGTTWTIVKKRSATG